MVQGALVTGGSFLAVTKFPGSMFFIKDPNDTKQEMIKATIWGAVAGFGASLIWPYPGFFVVAAVAGGSYWAFTYYKMYSAINRL